MADDNVIQLVPRSEKLKVILATGYRPTELAEARGISHTIHDGTEEQRGRLLGVVVRDAPSGFAFTMLTPDQADELALQLVRGAAQVRADRVARGLDEDAEG